MYEEGMPKSTVVKKFISAYGPKRKVALHFEGPGRTKQSFKDECDINVIMARYAATGVISTLQKLEPRYTDVTGMDYQNAMDLIANARSMFEDLPSSIRDRFHNSPRELLDFVHDERNREEGVALGLFEPKAPLSAHEGARGVGSEPAPQGAAGAAPVAAGGRAAEGGGALPGTAPKAS